MTPGVSKNRVTEFKLSKQEIKPNNYAVEHCKNTRHFYGNSGFVVSQLMLLMNQR